MKSYGVTIQMKATEQYFSVLLSIKLHKSITFVQIFSHLAVYSQIQLIQTLSGP